MKTIKSISVEEYYGLLQLKDRTGEALLQADDALDGLNLTPKGGIVAICQAYLDGYPGSAPTPTHRYAFAHGYYAPAKANQVDWNDHAYVMVSYSKEEAEEFARNYTGERPLYYLPQEAIEAHYAV